MDGGRLRAARLLNRITNQNVKSWPIGLTGRKVTDMKVKSLAEFKRSIKPGTRIVALENDWKPSLVGVVRVVSKVQSNCFYTRVEGQPGHMWSTANDGLGLRCEFQPASCCEIERCDNDDPAGVGDLVVYGAYGRKNGMRIKYHILDDDETVWTANVGR